MLVRVVLVKSSSSSSGGVVVVVGKRSPLWKVLPLYVCRSAARNEKMVCCWPSRRRRRSSPLQVRPSDAALTSPSVSSSRPRSPGARATRPVMRGPRDPTHVRAYHTNITQLPAPRDGPARTSCAVCTITRRRNRKRTGPHTPPLLVSSSRLSFFSLLVPGAGCMASSVPGLARQTRRAGLRSPSSSTLDGEMGDRSAVHPGARSRVPSGASWPDDECEIEAPRTRARSRVPAGASWPDDFTCERP